MNSPLLILPLAGFFQLGMLIYDYKETKKISYVSFIQLASIILLLFAWQI